MKNLIALALFAPAALSSFAHASCKQEALGRGIGWIEDQVDVPCTEKTAEAVKGATYGGITGYNITMVCANASIPNGTWVYLKSDCSEASDDEISTYLNWADTH